MRALSDTPPLRRQVVTALLALAASCVLTACQEGEAAIGNDLGDPRHGAQLIRGFGCGSCHDIPGIAGANGMVGPPLDRIAKRVYIAGMLRNTPDNMVAWLRNPQAIVPGNAMPYMGLSEADARDVGAYLATLK